MCFYECFSWLLPLQNHKKNDDVVYEKLAQEDKPLLRHETISIEAQISKSSDEDDSEWEDVV